MGRCLLFVATVLLAVAFTVISACRRNAPTPVAAPVSGIQTTPTAISLPAQLSQSEPQANAAADTPIEEPVKTITATAEPPESKERILLLAPAGPLIIEFHLTIDGQPHTDALAHLVEEVLRIADTDGDGRTMWKELCASNRIKYGQFGNLPIEGDNGEKQIIERYDIARDGIVSPSELPRFLTRNAGSARSFSIRGTLDHRDVNRRAAPTWRAIDIDENGLISADERSRAAALLGARDNDDDEILLVNELNPLLQTPDREMMDQRPRRGPDAARLLGPHADWSTVQRALESEYAGGRALREENFSHMPDLFKYLDANHDGRLAKAEFQRLNDAPPHVVIAADFGQKRESAAASKGSEQVPEADNEGVVAGLRLLEVAPELASLDHSVIEQAGRLTISLGSTILTFYTNDSVAGGDFAARAKQVLDSFDQNKDGYLEASEVPDSLQGQLGRFEAVDVDEDAKAYVHEIEAFLAQQQAGLRAQIHARATDREDLLFTALDVDHDDRLDSRETEATPARMAALDKNADGNLTSDELNEVLLIGLVRGSLENADATFALRPVTRRAPSSGTPRWFISMDANQDGVISRREFLGSPDQFARLDQNSNGLLELAELPN
jgi:Ca2+-binding EF-hand superfamily protein